MIIVNQLSIDILSFSIPSFSLENYRISLFLSNYHKNKFIPSRSTSTSLSSCAQKKKKISQKTMFYYVSPKCTIIDIDFKSDRGEKGQLPRAFPIIHPPPSPVHPSTHQDRRGRADRSRSPWSFGSTLHASSGCRESESIASTRRKRLS